MCSEESITLLGWKTLNERCKAHIKTLKCLEGNARDIFNDYFPTKCCDIHRYNTRNNYI